MHGKPILLPAACAVAFAIGVAGVRADALPKNITCTGCFFGLPVVLKLNPHPKPGGRLTKLLGRDLYFVDASKTVWKADSGDVTDGASIPSAFLGLLGGDRFEADFLPAAVLHDHYCDRPVRTWWQTARLFYQAMIANRTNVVKAKAMYYAVFAFGPHWGMLKIIPGRPCGEGCINVASPKLYTLQNNGSVVESETQQNMAAGEAYYERPARYDLARNDEAQQVYDKIRKAELEGTPLTLDQIDNLSTMHHPEDPFIQKLATEK